ncbi:hypothetical protein [Arcobacter arenosus]|uniref:Lipoprotein n=1 Tax=Arcobacter arenosus TaxID=2576037 RepID=A0A5R8XYS1_9BACT|nr:hypothetical protein [Arcobacter arenosus]TLP36157.1 hypothetical protein FDK22_12855 [Arcobacter arenosus]
MIKKYILVPIFILIVFSGCAKRFGYVNTYHVIEEESIVYKNYELNKKQSSYVGATMIRVNNYNKITKSSNLMKPTEDFTFNTNSSNNQIRFFKDDLFTISGSWKIDNITYTAITNRKLDSKHLLIKENGSIHNKIANVIKYGMNAGSAVTVLYTYEHKPKSVRFKTVTSTSNEMSKGQINYELIYTGLNKDSFMLTYREYTKDDLARPSFFQNLTYSKNKNQIRFRNLLIKIHSLDNEKIVFSVLEDNLI